jgi:hypothetical protein
MALFFLMLALLVSCSKSSSTGPGNGGGGGTGSGIDSSLAATVAQHLLTDLQDFLTYHASGLSAGMFRSFCSNLPIQGDTTDADSDFVTVNATYTFQCDTVFYNMRFHIVGQLQSRDNDDQDPWVGSSTLSGLSGGGDFLFEVASRDSLNPNDSTHVLFHGSISSTRQGQQYHNTLNHTIDYFEIQHNLQNGLDTTAYAYSFQGDVFYTPADPHWKPAMSGYKSGSLEIQGTLRPVGDPVLSLSTPTPLTMDSTCYDSLSTHVAGGVLNAVSGTDTLQVAWSGCNQYLVTLNGDTVQIP